MKMLKYVKEFEYGEGVKYKFLLLKDEERVSVVLEKEGVGVVFEMDWSYENGLELLKWFENYIEEMKCIERMEENK